MRIGKALINTDEMTAEELTVIITELRNIRKRKEQANELCANSMTLSCTTKRRKPFLAGPLVKNLTQFLFQKCLTFSKIVVYLYCSEGQRR